MSNTWRLRTTRSRMAVAGAATPADNSGQSLMPLLVAISPGRELLEVAGLFRLQVGWAQSSCDANGGADMLTLTPAADPLSDGVTRWILSLQPE